MSDKIFPSIVVLVGLSLILIPKVRLENFVRKVLKSIGLRVETKQVNLTKFVAEMIKLTGAVFIGVGLIMFFVLPFYSQVNNF